MVITDKFVFVHIPKSGGTFIRNILLHDSFKNINPKSDYFHHSPAQIYRGDLPIIFVRRSYESWVKSWTTYWSFRPKESTNPFLACTWSGGDFKKYYKCMYKYMTATENKLIEINFDNLRSDLCKALKKMDAISKDGIRLIMNSEKINESGSNPIK